MAKGAKKYYRRFASFSRTLPDTLKRMTPEQRLQFFVLLVRRMRRIRDRERRRG